MAKQQILGIEIPDGEEIFEETYDELTGRGEPTDEQQ